MTVGQQLHQARTARKLSFTDVTATTKIQPWVLEALEADRLTELMSPVYVKGFLGSYAKFLKLEPAPLLAELRWPGTPEPAPVAVAVAVAAPTPAPAAQPQPAAQPRPEPESVPQRASEPVRWERPAPASQQDAVPPPAPRRRPIPSPKPARPPVRVKLPTFQLPAVRLPNVRLPRFTMPQFTMPRVSLPRFSMPRVTLPRLSMPRVQLPEISPIVWRRATQAVALAGVIVAVAATHPVERLKKLPWPTVAKVEQGGAQTKKKAEPTIKIAAKPVNAVAKVEKAEKAEKTDKVAVIAKVEKPAEKVEKLARAEKPAEKPERGARAERGERAARAERAEKPAVKLAAANIAPIGGDAALKPPAPLPPAPIAPAPLELMMTANRTTWIKITADGKLISQQRLGRGANERWTARKQFEVVISKPSQVEVSLNGQSINAFAVAHRGKLLISHRGILPLPEPRSLADADSR